MKQQVKLAWFAFACRRAKMVFVFCLWLLLFLWCTALTVHAENVRFEVRKNQSGLFLEKSLFADELFGSAALIPGEAESGSLTLRNKAEQPVYYCLGKVRLEHGSEALFQSLHIKISERSGRKLYDGPLAKAAFAVRTLPSGGSERLIYELYLPISAGNETQGQSLDFQLSYLVADTPEALPDMGAGDGDSGDGNGGAGDGTGGSGDGSGNGGSEGSEGSGGNGSADGSGGSGGNDNSNGAGGGNGGNGSSGGSEGGGDNGNGSGGGNSGNGSSSGNAGAHRPGGTSGTGHGSGHGGNSAGTGHVAGKGYGSSGTGNETATGGVQSPGQSMMIYDHPDFSRTTPLYDGTWVLVDEKKQQWKYQLSDGTELAGGFAYLSNPYAAGGARSDWYHFEPSGMMSVGWVQTAGDIWYHMHDVSDGMLGAMTLGWYADDEDQRTYYLSPETGRMQTGWVKIREGNAPEKEYYFARLEDTYRQNWFFNTGFGRWMYDKLGNRSYGSLYRDERTPDGSLVGMDGVKLT